MKHLGVRLLMASLMAVALICSGGCSSGEQSASSTLNTDSLVSLTVSIHLLEAHLMQVRAQGDNPDTLAVALYDSLFRQYGTTREEYEGMLQHLTRQPDQYLAVLDSATARLERMKQIH